MYPNPKKVIAIIGGGFSGTLTAIQCCKRLEASISKSKDYSVILIEQSNEFSLGAAYSTIQVEHLLNVPAWNMSAFPDDKKHFLDWLTQNNFTFNKTDLVPRKIYGQYLQSLLNEAKAQYTDRLQLIQNKVISIHKARTSAKFRFHTLKMSSPRRRKSHGAKRSLQESRIRQNEFCINPKTTPSGGASHPVPTDILIRLLRSVPKALRATAGESTGGEFKWNINSKDIQQVCRYELHCEDGKTLVANQVVLTLGNFPPQNPPLKDKSFFNTSKRYWKNPWQADRKPLPNEATCLIIGTGLTMVDKVLELEATGHTGKIIALSRHGLLPFAHSPASLNPITDPWTETELKDTAESPLKLFRWLREQAKQDSDWRTGILKLRPSIQRVWKQWPSSEKKRFLRHCRAWWDVRRHLIDATVSKRLEALQQSGQLKIIAGRLESLEENENQTLCKYLDRHIQIHQEFNCDWVINCTGSDGGIAKSQDPLITQLRDSHQIQVDELRLGLIVDEQYHTLNAEGKSQANLFAMGSLLKGILWESIAVPELRQQAQQIAKIIVS